MLRLRTQTFPFDKKFLDELMKQGLNKPQIDELSRYFNGNPIAMEDLQRQINQNIYKDFKDKEKPLLSTKDKYRNRKRELEDDTDDKWSTFYI